MISEEHRKALRALHEVLADLEFPWAITGGLGFALHGMNVPADDIDLQTDREGAYKIENAFRQCVVKSVAFSEGNGIRSHFGELRICGVKVEIIGGVQKRLTTGEWESPVEVREHRTFVDFDGMRFPVLSLEYEEKAYRILGRIDKANLIKEWLTRSLE